ncbi:MAG: RAMP superfamily CRISPR-associated protein [Chloroflexi bacterium]|nr:RAMP superfamily CRISPR-associated protein [Chloroflexota bacterium]
MTIRLTFEIILESDYHVGAGQRAGLTVDSALLRDHGNAPVLRGTALAGLLRDGLRDLVEQADSFGLKRSTEEACKRLFGTPAQRKRWSYSSSQLSEAVLPHTNRDKDPIRWGAQDVARVRIEPRTRRAAPQQLFTEEEGDRRLRFQFTAACEGETENDRADAALLAAAARMVRHLGAARRRGRGVCRLDLIAAENFVDKAGKQSWTQAALDAFRQYWLEGESLPAVPRKTEAVSPVSTPAAGGQKRFRLLALLQEPLLIAYRSETANAYETLDNVPGTAILGALASRAAYHLDLDAPADHILFTRLFLRGGVRVSGLMPAGYADYSLYPSVAAPQSLQQCENYPRYGNNAVKSPHPVHNRLHNLVQTRQCAVCQGKLEEVTGYVQFGAHQISQDIRRREEIHIQMDRVTGRALEDNFYTYHALEAGQWLVGELTCEAADWPQVQALTGLAENQRCELRLGKATQRGYGLVHFVLEPMKDSDPSPWVLQPMAKRVLAPAGTEAWQAVSLLFLTDAILIDAWGRFYQTLDAEALASLLQVNREHIRQVQPFVSMRQVDSFNSHRRLPRWREQAIQAGSVVGFELLADSAGQTTKRLQQVELDGLGLRRQEGFGRVAFNHPALSAGIAREIGLSQDMRRLIVPAVEAHALQEKADFREEWLGILDRSQAEHAGEWRKITTVYSAVGRLIFIYRYRPINEIQKWLAINDALQPVALGQPQQLWGNKPLLGRDKNARVSGEELKLIHDLLGQLAKYPAAYWPAGLELLAERIGEQAELSRIKEGSRNG